MDTLENYRAEILKKNKRHVEEDDPICVLHTFLAKFEADLVASLNAQLQASEARLEGQCDRLEQAEKKRLERALSFVKSSAEAQLNGLPQKLNGAINAESFIARPIQSSRTPIASGRIATASFRMMPRSRRFCIKNSRSNRITVQ